MEVEWMEHKGLARMMIFLLDNPRIQKVAFRKILNIDSQNATKLHNFLFENGYIDVYPDPSKLLFQLTSKGERIAKLFKRIMIEGED